MGRGDVLPLRALPRLFLEGFDPEAGEAELPRPEYEKLTKVLRLGSGDQVAVLPGDGRIVRCQLRGRSASPMETTVLDTEPKRPVTLVQALPKPEKLEEVVRMGSELGVARFVLFASERSVVRWDAAKRAARQRRLEAIAREACEVAFRARLPSFAWAVGLAEALTPGAIVLSEGETLSRTLRAALPAAPDPVALVVGPEGGWAPREVALIGDRAVTLGPRVLRVDTAACAALALVLAEDPQH